MFTRLRYEVRALGLGTFGLPVLVTLIFLGVALLAGYDVTHAGGGAAQAHHDTALGLLFLVEFGLPPVAGIAAAYLIDSNPAVELHLSLPTPYTAIMWLRFALFVVWSALVGLLITWAVHQTGYWLAPQPAPQDQLAWGAPLAWFVAGGAMLSLLLRNRVASSSVLGMLWLGEIFLRSYLLQHSLSQKLYLFLTLSTLPHGDVPNAPYWLANRLTLLGMAAAFLITLAWLLRQNEALLGHER